MVQLTFVVSPIVISHIFFLVKKDVKL